MALSAGGVCALAAAGMRTQAAATAARRELAIESGTLSASFDRVEREFRVRIKFNCLASIIISIILTIVLNLLLRGCTVFSSGGVVTF